MSLQKPYFAPLEVGGELIEFTHLEPFQMVVPSEKARKDLQVHVVFSNHCFSRGLSEDEDPAGEGVFLDHQNKHRIFCPERFELSRNLPEYIQQLNHPKAKVRQTARERNWTHVVELETEGYPYYIFFSLKRAPKSNFDDLRMVIESAYQLGENYKKPKLLEPMKFQLLCGKVYRGDPVTPKR